MTVNKKYSFTSANVYPVKLFKAEVLSVDKKIIPIHIQLILTNKCNLNCAFCSCQDRNQKQELSISKVNEIIKTYSSLGCKAVTITGGGEPLLHKNINNIIKSFHDHKIKIGLVTNGLCLDMLEKDTYQYINWIRISFDDNRQFDQLMINKLNKVVPNQTSVDWSFSYVITKSVNCKNIQRVVDYANQNKFTHVRLVTNILDVENIIDMSVIKENISNDDIVLYQGRKQYTAGSCKCLISLLKPVIDAGGQIYPCCGTQYAKEGQQLDYNTDMSMGGIGRIKTLYEQQLFFDGSRCKKCYYRDYNEVLSILLSNIEHKEFV